MSKQFLYARLTFTPKEEIRVGSTLGKRDVVVEVLKNAAQRQESEIVDEDLCKVLAIDLARKAALGTFPTTERSIELYEEETPTWLDERLKVMNERPCDHEENGARAWRID
jgi:hypothetical protein